MSSDYTISQIKEKAQEILDKHFDKNFPVNPLKIAEQLGYQVFKFDANKNELGKVSGAVNHTDKKIFYNSAEGEGRSRFTLAHEIGHIILHPNENMIDYRTPLVNGRHDSKEQNANSFAAELLMPEKEFKSACIIFRSIEKVADYFGVSVESASIRAYILGENLAEAA